MYNDFCLSFKELFMKKCCICLAVNLILCMLMGCGTEEVVIAEPAFEISKKGVISQTMVESFDKDYYSVDELRSEFEGAISEFNGSNQGDEAHLEELHAENGKVYVNLRYDSSVAAGSFLNEVIFYGTVNDAYDMGHMLDVSLKSVSDGTVISKAELMDMKKNHIFICQESGLVLLETKILYVSANVEVTGDKSARISSDSDGLAYIVTK